MLRCEKPGKMYMKNGIYPGERLRAAAFKMCMFVQECKKYVSLRYNNRLKLLCSEMRNCVIMPKSADIFVITGCQRIS